MWKHARLICSALSLALATSPIYQNVECLKNESTTPEIILLKNLHYLLVSTAVSAACKFKEPEKIWVIYFIPTRWHFGVSSGRVCPWISAETLAHHFLDAESCCADKGSIISKLIWMLAESNSFSSLSHLIPSVSSIGGSLNNEKRNTITYHVERCAKISSPFLGGFSFSRWVNIHLDHLPI